MKKVLAFLLTAIVVMSASVCIAFAAPSAEAQGVISGVVATDKKNNKTSMTVKKIDKKVGKAFTNTLKGLKNENKKKKLKIVGHYDVSVAGKPQYPLNVVLDVLGISASSDAYVLLQKGDEVITVTPTIKDGKVMFELEEEVDKLALVVDSKTADKVEEENGVLSPQTSDFLGYVVMLFVSAVAMLFVSKKVKA